MLDIVNSARQKRWDAINGSHRECGGVSVVMLLVVQSELGHRYAYSDISSCKDVIVWIAVWLVGSR